MKDKVQEMEKKEKKKKERGENDSKLEIQHRYLHTNQEEQD